MYFNGFQLTDGYSASFKDFNLSGSTYTETALGYSRDVNGRFGFGAKAKLLYGNNYFAMNASQANFAYANNQVDAVANIAVLKASPFNLNDRLGLEKPATFFDYILPEGFGGALDLGVHYKPIKNLALAAAVTDLGLMRWGKLNSINYQLNYKFDAMAWKSSHPEFTGTDVPVDSIIADIRNNFGVTRGDKPGISNYLTPKLNVSAEYNILNNLLGVGVLSRSMFREDRFLHELTAAFNIRPANWVNLALSYSITNGKASNFGFGANFSTGKFNIFLSADYIPFQYVGLDLQQFDPVIPAISLPLGYNSDRINFALGFNYAIGTKKDTDKDGISDKFDKCPNTPLGVKVDSRGCQL